MLDLGWFLASVIYFMLPAYSASVIPILAKRFRVLECLALSLDGGKKFKKEPILGTHKTLRGLLLGTIVGVFVGYCQQFLFSFPLFNRLSLVDYSGGNGFIIGFLLGFGALFGDSLFSFFKRRLHKKEGQPWFPWDQISLAIGVILLSFLFYPLFWKTYFSIIIITFFWHIIAAKTAYYLKIRQERW